uniref:Uncharacterized protein n=1 Tax=Parascaris equorum TaxID=6256 RepID=A0A914S6H0_PAREQ
MSSHTLVAFVTALLCAKIIFGLLNSYLCYHTKIPIQVMK